MTNPQPTPTVEDRSRELRRQIAKKQAARLFNVRVENVFDENVTYDQQTDQWKKAS